MALLWDERHGWSIAIETHSGEDLSVVRYLGGHSVFPPPGVVADFLVAARTHDPSIGQHQPPHIRPASDHHELQRELHRIPELRDLPNGHN